MILVNVCAMTFSNINEYVTHLVTRFPSFSHVTYIYIISSVCNDIAVTHVDIFRRYFNSILGGDEPIEVPRSYVQVSLLALGDDKFTTWYHP